MTTRTRLLFIIIACILLLSTALVLYYLQWPSVAIVTDSFYRRSMLTDQAVLDIRVKLIQLRKRLVIIDITDKALLEKETLAEELHNVLSRKDIKTIVTSPIITSLSSSLPNIFESETIFIGIGQNVVDSPFDYMLIRQEIDEGFLDALRMIRSQTIAGGPVSALLYPASSQKEIDEIIALVEESPLVSIVQDKKIQASTVSEHLDRMKRLQVFTVLAYDTERLDLYLNDPGSSGIQWVVDGEYRNAVRIENLKGWIADDLYRSIQTIIETETSFDRKLPAIELPLRRVLRMTP